MKHHCTGLHQDADTVVYMQEDKVAVLVGTVTDDVRLFNVPKLQVACLRVTETARARILAVSTLRLMKQSLRMRVTTGSLVARQDGTVWFSTNGMLLGGRQDRQTDVTQL